MFQTFKFNLLNNNKFFVSCLFKNIFLVKVMKTKNNELNGGFPPLILKNKNIKSNNKERYFTPIMKNNLTTN